MKYEKLEFKYPDEISDLMYLSRTLPDPTPFKPWESPDITLRKVSGVTSC